MAAKTVIPPGKGAPDPSLPIAVRPDPGALAPAPLIDRYPLVLGQQLSATYVANCFRLANTGYRMQFVDLLDELIEMDPHLYAVVQKRILSTANGQLEVTSCKLPDGHPDQGLADEVRDLVATEIHRIPDLTKALASLLWGVYYGLTAAEIMWSRDGDGWHVDRLEFVHSRRLSYPDAQTWSVHIWDQGQVFGWQTPWGSSATNRDVFGMRIEDWPGKFITFAPQLRGDYPTRDGIGRECAVWALFKRVGARGAVEYLERFAKPLMDVSWTTQADGNPREATKEDIATAKNMAAMIGPGSGSYATHPDTIKLEPKYADGTRAKVTWPEWLEYCDSQMSKAAVGGTLGTDHTGSGGLGGAGTAEVQERGEADLEQYDGTVLGETLKRDLAAWIVRLNRPEALHLIPTVSITVAKDPDPSAVLDLAAKATDMGMPVDADDLAEKVGLKLIDNPDPKKPRRTFKSDVVDPTSVDDSLMSDEAKQQKADAAASKLEVDKLRAQNPPQMGQPGQPQGGKPPAGGGKPPQGKNPAIRSADEARDDAAIRVVLLADREDQDQAVSVYEQLLGDYPARALGWVGDLRWAGPMLVQMDDIDFSSSDSWRASYEPIDSYIDKIKDGRLKPIILVRRPNNDKLMIVDGHHRTLANKKLGRPVLAYVAEVPSARGPWTELHDMQKKGRSGRKSLMPSYEAGNSSYLPASRLPSRTSSFLPSYVPSQLPSFASSVLPSYRSSWVPRTESPTQKP